MVAFNRALVPLKEYFFTSAKITDQHDATIFCNCQLGADAEVGIAGCEASKELSFSFTKEMLIFYVFCGWIKIDAPRVSL